MTLCSDSRRFLREQEKCLHEAIEREKWFRSEEAGHDIGHDAAVESFTRRSLDEFARWFRSTYCGRKCRDRHACEMAKHVQRIPSLHDMHRYVTENGQGA